MCQKILSAKIRRYRTLYCIALSVLIVYYRSVGKFSEIVGGIVPTPTSVAEALYKLHCIVHYDGSILQQDRSAQVLSQTGCVESLILYTR